MTRSYGEWALRFQRTLQLGVKSLWMHRLRSLLTALGIVFGVASVIAMLAIGEGASFEAQEQIRQLGSENVIIRSSKPAAKQRTDADESLVVEYGITYRDLRQIEATLPGIEMTVPGRSLREFVWNNERDIEAEILGTIPAYPRMRNVRLLEGRFFGEVEMEGAVNVCVLAEDTAAELFPLARARGREIRIKSTYFRVIGIVESSARSEAAAEGRGGRSQGQEGGAELRLLVPLSTLIERFGDVSVKYRSGSFEAEKVAFSEVTVRVADPEKVVATANAIGHILKRNHSEPDFRIIVPVELLRQAEKTKQIFNTVLGSIAAISLLVGGIGIMNIMLATVTERTREIGIRRALGARQRDIIQQFLTETVLLSGAGGVLGVALGITIPKLVSQATEMPTIVQLWAPTLAFTISLAVGILFGIYPALRAARMSPVEALRHE